MLSFPVSLLHRQRLVSLLVEVFQQQVGLVLQIATLCWVAVQFQDGSTASKSLIILSEVDMADAHNLESFGAHDAWLDGDKKIEIVCIMQVILSFELLQADHLGVGTGIFCLVSLVMCSFDDLEATSFWELSDKNTANRHLAIFNSQLGLLQRLLHKHFDLLLV